MDVFFAEGGSSTSSAACGLDSPTSDADVVELSEVDFWPVEGGSRLSVGDFLAVVFLLWVLARLDFFDRFPTGSASFFASLSLASEETLEP